MKVLGIDVVEPCVSCFEDRPDAGHTVPLGPIDYTCAPLGKFGLTFVYQHDTIDIQMLKRALSCALAEYPYLAGHIAVEQVGNGREKLNYVYSYRGIEWTDKVCKGKSVSDVVSNVYCDSDEKGGRTINSCFAAPDMSRFEPEERDAVHVWTKSDYLMQVCASKFDDGLILTVSVSHLAIDVSPLRAVLESWSKHYATSSEHGDSSTFHGMKANVSTVQEGMFQKAREALEKGFSYTYDADKDLYWIVDGRKRFQRIPTVFKLLGKLTGKPSCTVIHVRSSKLKILKEKALKECQVTHPEITRLSDNDIMVASLWKALATSLKHSSKDRVLTLSVDMRCRYDPAMPTPSWGNCSCVIPVASVTKSHRDLTLSELAVRVRKIVGTLHADKFQADATRATQILETSDDIPTVEWSQKAFKLALSDMVFPMSVPNWYFSKGWNEAQFGTNAPVWVQPMSLGGLVAIIIPSLEGPEDPGYLINLQQTVKQIHIDDTFDLL